MMNGIHAFCEADYIEDQSSAYRRHHDNSQGCVIWYPTEEQISYGKKIWK